MKFFPHRKIHSVKELSAFYKKLLDQVPDLIFEMLCENGLYSIVFAGDSINDIYEITVEQFKSDTDIVFRERIFPEDVCHILKSLEESKNNLTRWETEFRVQLPKKGTRWLRLLAKPELLENGNIIFYGRVSDITSAKEQELKLKISEERLKFALDAASEGLWDWDMKTNTTFFSGEAMKIIGRKKEDVIVPSEFWSSRVHPDDVKSRNAAKKKGLKKGATYESIYRIRTESGKYRWLLSRGQVVQFDENNNPVRAIGVHKDITKLKVKELELANTINIISSQNNRLSNFAHIVSHNLRSHAGNLRMLLDLFKNAPSEERKEMLEHLEGISDGLTVTVTHLKELVEIQTEIKLLKEKLNLRHYLKHILNILHNEIKKHGVVIEVNIPLDVTVNYNPAYLESILLNFTTNAIKYSNPKREPVLLYDFEIIDGVKVLSITDNGLGIDLKKHKTDLFGMYKTFHKNQNSRGIGLFITKNQIEAMGGRVEVYSEVNKGTTFKIFFNEED